MVAAAATALENRATLHLNPCAQKRVEEELDVEESEGATQQECNAKRKTHGTSRKKEEGKRERREREEEREDRKKEKKDAWNQLKRETRSFCLLLLIAAATPCGVTVFSSEPHAIFAFAVMLGNSPFASFD